MEIDNIYNMDCLEGMKQIPDGTIDAVICDLPYGTTDCAWDSVIPMEPLWEQYRRILKHQGSVLLFGSEPFSSMLRMSNLKWYKYDWIWKKDTPSGYQHAKNMPMKDYEIISVFSAASMGHANLLGDRRMTYNPQGTKNCHVIEHNKLHKNGYITGSRPSHKETIVRDVCNYPRMILEYNNQAGEVSNNVRIHPTQKPVDLLRYLVLTYTNEGDTVLDNCMGSGTTAVACIKERRHFIGFELSKEYFDKAVRRIKAEQAQLTLF